MSTNILLLKKYTLIHRINGLVYFFKYNIILLTRLLFKKILTLARLDKYFSLTFHSLKKFQMMYFIFTLKKLKKRTKLFNSLNFLILNTIFVIINIEIIDKIIILDIIIDKYSTE